MSENTDTLSAGMTLYTYFRSSTAFRVRIALNLKGIKPKQVPIHLLRHDQYADDYRHLNPQGVVPTLVHNGHTIGQSLAIIEYLDEIVPEPPLLPATPFGRARCRQIAYAIACEIHPFGNLKVREYMVGTLDRTENELAAWQRHWMEKGFAAIEQLVGDDRFCFGNTVTLADVCVVPQLFNAHRIGLDITPFPKLARIEKAAYELPAFNDAHPQNQPDAE